MNYKFAKRREMILQILRYYASNRRVTKNMQYIVLINLPRASRSFEVSEVKCYRSREFQKCGPAEVILVIVRCRGV